MRVCHLFGVLSLSFSGALLLLPQTSSKFEEAYATAEQAMRAGQYDRAERILRTFIVAPKPGMLLSGELARENARLLALLATLLSDRSSPQSASAFAAESYMAWAIHDWPCALSYWQDYVGIRLRRQGSAGFANAVQTHQPVRYAFPGSALLIGPPVSDETLSAVVSVWAKDRQRGISLLEADARRSGRCIATDGRPQLDGPSGPPPSYSLGTLVSGQSASSPPVRMGTHEA